MITLFKHVLQADWNQAKGYLYQDLENLEVAVNHLWGKAFGSDLKLKNDVVDGDGGIIRTGDDGNVTTGDVLLTDLEDIPASSLIGRGSSSAGSPEVIDLGPTLLISGTTLGVNPSSLVGDQVALHTLCGGI